MTGPLFVLASAVAVATWARTGAIAASRVALALVVRNARRSRPASLFFIAWFPALSRRCLQPNGPRAGGGGGGGSQAPRAIFPPRDETASSMILSVMFGS